VIARIAGQADCKPRQNNAVLEKKFRLWMELICKDGVWCRDGQPDEGAACLVLS
jgi:hypothetical protein